MKLPQLSLRDLFWLVALVATVALVGFGWWRDRSNLNFQYTKKNLEHIGMALKVVQLQEAIEEEGYQVEESADGITLTQARTETAP